MEAKDVETKRIVKGGIVLLASAAMAFLAIGCGEQRSKTSAQGIESQGVAAGTEVAAAANVPAAVVSAEATTTEAEATATPSAEPLAGTTPADTLPPDVAASVTEAIAAPGGVVEITAEGSPDVTSATLTDAVGKKYPFAYEAATDRWRVFYRVPIRTRTEQLGLSVTATNGANRWKRIWVFVDIGRGAPSVAEADSAR